jgi:hypothetical protein
MDIVGRIMQTQQTPYVVCHHMENQTFFAKTTIIGFDESRNETQSQSAVT